MTRPKPHAHTPDNDGQCHFCGLLLEPDWYANAYGEKALDRKQTAEEAEAKRRRAR